MSVVRTDQRTNTVEVVLAWTFTVVSFGYMLPWAIAASRGKSNSLAIGLLNFFLGWTFVGWVVALVMACGSHQAAGANIYISQHQANYAPGYVDPASYGQPTYGGPAGVTTSPAATPPYPAAPPLVAQATSSAPAGTPSLAATPTVPAPPATPAGWYRDPDGGHLLRYWDGAAWTEHTAPVA